MENQENLTAQTEETPSVPKNTEEIIDESTENVSRETMNDLKISFDAKYVDIFDGLESTDRADGTNRKSRKLFLVLGILMIVQVFWFMYTRSGIALIFAVVLGAMALALKKKLQKFNVEIAKAFEAEGRQTVILKDDCFMLNEKTVSYEEIVTLYEFKNSFSIIYQGNHVYVIPKNVLDEEQRQQFISKMKQEAGSVYQDLQKK